MCTLTLYKTQDTLILTHNRDENINRPAAFSPQLHKHEQAHIWYSKDPKGNGTWMAANAQKAVCLLNGAKQPHPILTNYKHSRGLVPLAYFNYPSVFEFVQKYSFDGLQAFTLILVEPDKKVYQLTWDQQTVSLNPVLNKYQLWSSTTLYTPQMQQERQQAFELFLQSNSEPTAEDLYKFHTQTRFSNADTNLIMQRPSGVLTQCVMQFIITKNQTQAHYHNLLNNQTYVETLG